MATPVGSKERAYCHKMNEALKTVARDVCHVVFVWATPDKDINETIIVYIDKLKASDSSDKSNNYKVNPKICKFNKEQEAVLLNDPSCKKADITLLHLLFKSFATCVEKFDHDVWRAGFLHLESLLTKIKEFRNKVAHEDVDLSKSEFDKMAKELKDLLTKTLEMAKERYKRTDAELKEKIKEMENGLFEVFHQVLGEEELLSYSHATCTKALVNEAKIYLKNATPVIIEPLHFLPEEGVRVNVPDIFSKIQVGNKDGQVQDATALLSVVDPATSTPQLLLTEGPAGMGKSTLLMLVSHEWLEGCHGQLKGLDKYQLILRVHCRDRHLESLDDLLRDTLPEVYSKYRNLTLPLIKECKLLLLLDGIDEVNKESRKVLDDILHTFKNASKTTLLITSRTEFISDFMRKCPTEYHVEHIKLLGIAKEDRLNFVIRYINLFQHYTGNTVDINKLQPTINSICDQDHFKVPLNLVFLAWQCTHEPNSVTGKGSQTQLYFWAHNLNVQKLIERLLKKPELTDMDEEKLIRLLDECQEAVYLSMLRATIDNHVILMEREVRHITSTCDTRGIHYREVLSIFFTKKTIRTPLGVKHQYYAPHKGLQDYYGAHHVVSQLKQQPDSSIKEVIKGVLGSHPLQVKNFIYILLHLAGLLHHHITPVPDQLQEELVQLLHEAEVLSWGEVVEATEYSKAVITAIIRLLPHGEKMEVGNHVPGHSALLAHLPPTEVIVSLSGSTPDLTPLTQVLTRHTFTIVTLWEYFYPKPTSTPDSFLKILMDRDDLVEYRGQWSGWMTRLPSSLKKLDISVFKDVQVQTLLDTLRSLTHLGELHVHVTLPVNPDDITTCLPGTKSYVALRLSGLIDDEEAIDRVCYLISKLKPRSQRYTWLEFSKTTLSKEGWKRLLEGLIQFKVKTKWVCVPEDQAIVDYGLETLFKRRMGCYLKGDCSL